MADPDKLEKHPFRQSLIDKPLMADVSKDFLMLEGVLTCFFIMVFGSSLLGLLISFIAIGACHYPFMLLSREDPHLPRIILRHYLSKDHFDIGLHPRQKEPKAPRSVPKSVRN